MLEEPPEQPLSSPSTKPAGRLRWLFEPARRQLLLPVSGLWILALDWLLFSQNVLSLGLATPVVVVCGFLLGAAGTFYFQWRYASDGYAKAAFKAFVAGGVVGVPWPLAGTIVGGWVLLASGLGKARSKVLRK